MGSKIYNSKKIKSILNCYLALGKIKKIEFITHNNINSTIFLIQSQKGEYVLRNFTDGSPPEKIEKICQILNSCYNKRIKVQKPIKNKNGTYVLKKEKIYITKYYPGNTFSGTKKEFIDVAKNLAKMHKALEQNSIKYNYNTNQSFYRILNDDELKMIKKKINKKFDAFDRIVNKNFVYLQKYFQDNRIPINKLNSFSKKQLIHHDIHPGNVIFQSGKVIAIIDFNSIRKGSRIEDICFTSFRFSIFKNNNYRNISDRIKLFIETYQKYGDINEKEINTIKIHLKQKFLGKISFILKNRYFYNSNIWLSDFQKNLAYLKKVEKLNFE